MQSVSLNKFIAESGYCSRREADDLIAQGRVMVNDEAAKVGDRITDTDVVSVDFEIIKFKKKEDITVLLYNKPEGLTCTMELADSSSIMHFLKYPKRVFPIGRLDKDSEGLLLLTNDGDIVNKILRSGNKHEKEYWVTLKSPYDAEFLRKMAAGVYIGNGHTTLPCKIRPLAPRKFSITIVQGLNRQIRKMCSALGAKVATLQRVRMMHLYLGDINPGKYRKLTEIELRTLLNLTEQSSNTAPLKSKKIGGTKFKSKAPLQKKSITKNESAHKNTTKDSLKKVQINETSKPEPASKSKKTTYKEFRSNKKK